MKKRIKKKKTQVFIGIVMMAALFMGTACGGKKAEESPQEAMEEAEDSAVTEPEGETGTNIINESTDKTEGEAHEAQEERQANIQAVTKLSETTQHQISSFIASNAYADPEYSGYENMQKNGPSLKAIVDYISFQHERYGTIYRPWDEPSDGLPFQWGTYIEDGAWDTEGYTGVYQVSKEEFRRFYENGWGIQVPENMEYREGEEYPDGFYGAELGETGLGSTWDPPLVSIEGDQVEITGYEDGVYSLSGYFWRGPSDEPWEEIDEEMIRYAFTATAVESGDAEVFDGLQITGFQVEEKEQRYF